jgi:Rrf2 family nitric oxide-sensitive transcriptional repressor
MSQVKDIAEIYGISHDHLRKVVHNLSINGILDSTKGKNGGVRLAKDPEEILVGDFLRLVEPSGEFVECLHSKGNNCIISKQCRFKKVLNGALEQFFEHLNQYSFGDLLKNNKPLEEILG